MPLCSIHVNVPTQLILIQASVPGSRLEITVKLTTFNGKPVIIVRTGLPGATCR